MTSTAYAYLDHAATTPMRREAVEAMLPFLTERFANPSGSHRFSREVRAAVDDAREVVAEVVGCTAGDVIFTGGGTEADNTAIIGSLHGTPDADIAVCPAVEHHAVLHVVEHHDGRVVGVDAAGSVDLNALAQALDDRVAVVSVMAVNNEVGTITDLAAVAAVVRRHAPQAALHTDAVQAASWLDLRTATAEADFVSLSAHKFGGPKGVGVLVARHGRRFDPLLLGGGQERDRRSGTHNVAGIVACAVAVQITDRDRTTTTARVAALRDRLLDTLTTSIDDARETVPRDRKVAGSAHICFDGVENESLLFLLDEAGVCASAASACASGAMEPSHVLAAMGVPTARARGAVRFTLGTTTTDADVDRCIDATVDAVTRLRRFSEAR